MPAAKDEAFQMLLLTYRILKIFFVGRVPLHGTIHLFSCKAISKSISKNNLLCIIVKNKLFSF